MKIRISKYWRFGVSWNPRVTFWGFHSMQHDWQRMRAFWIWHLSIEWWEE